MGYLLLWIESLVASILLVALVTACSARLNKRWAQVLWPVLASFFVLAKATAFTIAAVFLASCLVAPDWRAYFVSLTVLIAVGATVIVIRGLRRTDGDAAPPPAQSWPRGRIALGLGAAAILNLMTYNNLDNTMKLKLANTSSAASALALSVAPPRVPDRQNAGLVYEAAFRATPEHESLPKHLQEVVATGNAKRDKAFYSKPAVAEYLRLHEPALRLLRRATDVPDCYFDHNYAGPSTEMLLPEIIKMRDATRLLRLRARFRASRGDMKGALADTVAMGRLADHINQQPILISHMLAIACMGMQVQCLESVLAFGPVTREDLASWPNEPTRPNSRALVRALRMEEAFGLRIMSSILDDDSANTLNQLMGGSNPVSLGLLQSPWRVFILPGDVAAYPRTMRKAQALAAQPYYKSRTQWDEFEPRLRGKGTGILTAMLIPALTRVAENSARLDAKNRLADLGVAATRYKLKHGKYPAQLTDMIPEFLPAVPTDPMTGKPMNMAATEDGLIIYSLGPDMKDDGGAEWEGGKRTGDYTFCLGKAYETRRLKKE